MPDAAGPVSYRQLATDRSLLSIFVIGGVGAVGVNAVPVALPAIGTAFGLTESGIGLVMTAFFLPVLATHPVVGMLADFYGRRRVVLASLFLFGASGVAVLAVSTFAELLVLRAVQGIAFAGTLPLTATLTGDLYTGVEGSAAQGIRSGLVGLASAVTPVVAGVIVVLAWQYPFALFAITFPALVAVYRYYRDPVEPRDHGPDPGQVGVELRAYWRRIWEALDQRLAVLIGGGFVLFFLKGGFMTFAPVFVVRELGATVTGAGVILGLYGAVRVVVSPLSGSVVARIGRRATLVFGAGLAVVGIGVIPFVPTLPVLAGATAAYAAGEALLNPVLNDAIAASAADRQRAGIMSGLNVLKDGALAVSPVLLGGLIGAYGFTSAFLLAAALGAGYGLVLATRLPA